MKAYSTEVTPYEQLGCIPEIYSMDCFSEIRNILIPNIPKNNLVHLRLE